MHHLGEIVAAGQDGDEADSSSADSGMGDITAGYGGRGMAGRGRGGAGGGNGGGGGSSGRRVLVAVVLLWFVSRCLFHGVFALPCLPCRGLPCLALPYAPLKVMTKNPKLEGQKPT